MSQGKKITINAFEKVMKENYTPIEEFEWNGLHVVVKKTLSLSEMIGFVGGVVNACFAENDEFHPEAMDFAIRTSILERYANFTMPQNLELQYQLLYCTDAVDAVVSHINNTQFNEILSAIRRKIDMRAKANIEAVYANVSRLCAVFENLQKQVGDLFAGIGEGEIKGIVDAMAKGPLDEEKVVQAYMTHRKESDSDSDSANENGSH